MVVSSISGLSVSSSVGFISFPVTSAEVPGFTSIGLIRSISLHCGQGNLMCSLAKSESAVYFLELMGELL